MSPLISALPQRLLDIAFPPLCLACRRENLLSHPGICPSCWQKLSFIHKPWCPQCGTALLQHILLGSKCASCLTNQPAYDFGRSIFSYKGLARELVLAFKHGDATFLTPLFAQWFAPLITDIRTHNPVFIPVPLHHRRIWHRRYNQAALLAHFLAKKHGVTYLPQGLRRHRATPPQSGRDFSSRYHNIKGAFHVPDKYRDRIEDAFVVLVDDVVTTGATMQESARILKKHGAQTVGFLAICRVTKEIC